MLDRRTFLAASTATLAGLSLTPGALLAAAGNKVASLESRLNKDTFTALLGQSFTINVGSDPLVAELVRIDDATLSPQVEQFSITFRGPCGCRLTEGIYAVQHPQMGRIALYLKPVKEDLNSDYLEADFSLLRYV